MDIANFTPEQLEFLAAEINGRLKEKRTRDMKASQAAKLAAQRRNAKYAKQCRKFILDACSVAHVIRTLQRPSEADVDPTVIAEYEPAMAEARAISDLVTDWIKENPIEKMVPYEEDHQKKLKARRQADKKRKEDKASPESSPASSPDCCDNLF